MFALVDVAGLAGILRHAVGWLVLFVVAVNHLMVWYVSRVLGERGAWERGKWVRRTLRLETY